MWRVVEVYIAEEVLDVRVEVPWLVVLPCFEPALYVPEKQRLLDHVVVVWEELGVYSVIERPPVLAEVLDKLLEQIVSLGRPSTKACTKGKATIGLTGC